MTDHNGSKRVKQQGKALASTADDVDIMAPADADQTGTDQAPAPGGEAARHEAHDAPAKLAKILDEARAIHRAGGDVDAQCRLEGRLTVLHGAVSNEDYWRAHQELRDLFASAITSKVTGRTRRPGINESAVIDPGSPAEPAPSTHPDDPAPGADFPVVRAQGNKVVPGTHRGGRTRARTGSRARANAPVGGKLNGAGSTTEATTPTGADQSTPSAQDRQDGHETDKEPALLDAIEIHPLAKAFPEMSPQEFELFKASIAAHGQREPILRHKGQIVDGRHTYRACRELGIAPKYEEWDCQGSLLALVIDRNLRRRHLSASQRALVAARLKPELEKEARANMSRGGQGLANLPTLHSRDQAAQACNVSSRLVGTAEAVATRGAPELIAAVQRDEVAVSTAAELLGLKLEKQAEVVARGPRAVRAKVKQLRETKSRKKTRRTGVTAQRPDASVSLFTSGAGDGLLPPPDWLASFPVRSQLAHPAGFDGSAILWWIAHALLARLDLPPDVADPVVRAMYAGFEPKPLDLVIATEPPTDWRLCFHCHGEGVEEDGAICSGCGGLGFYTLPISPADLVARTRGVRRPSVQDDRSRRGRPAKRVPSS